MKNGEMYVIKLLGCSARAQAVAAGVLGEVTAISQLRVLQEAEGLARLAQQLHCAPAEAFAQLSQQLRAAFEPPQLPLLTLAHLQQLHDHAAQARLTQALHCQVAAVLTTLFDPTALHQTLEKLSPAPVAERPTLPQMLQMLSRPPHAAQLQQLHGVGPGDWGPILERENWLLPQAVAHLERAALSQHWPAAEATRILAALLASPDRSRSPRKAEAAQVLDWLALTYLHARVQWMSGRMRDQALIHAQAALQQAPALTGLALLPIWLEFYERGAIARALVLLGQTKSPAKADRLTFLLLNSLQRLGPVFVQCLACCDPSLPALPHLPWPEQLNPEPPYPPTDPLADSEFP